VGEPTVVFVNTRSTMLESIPAFDAAQRLGLDVVVLADRPTNIPPGLVVETVDVDTYDSRALSAAARKVADRRDVRGVVGWREQDVEGVAVVAAELGLPGHSLTAVRAIQHKGRARELLTETAPGLSVEHRSFDQEQAIDTAGMPLPAIVKPVGSSGSRGIRRVESETALAEAIEWVRGIAQPGTDRIFRRHAGGVIVEEYVEGSEHSVEAILLGGRVLVAMVTDKWVEPVGHLEYLQIHPSSLEKTRLQSLLAATARVVSGLELGTGAVHVEYRFHRDGTPRVIEVNARAGGGCITSHLVKMAWDFDFSEAVIAVSCGIEVVECAAAPRAVAGSLDILAESEGTFKGVSGLDAVLANSAVQPVSVDQPLGSEIVLPPASYTQHELATVICAGYSNDAVKNDLLMARDIVKPVIKP